MKEQPTPEEMDKFEKYLEDQLQKAFEKEGILVDQFALVLHNDSKNSFQKVMQCLVMYCKHFFIQAEQCAHIVHYKGKCEILSGKYEKMKEIADALTAEGLSVTLDRKK
jgi:ATP-dependent Clp protease adaptor protein ClpS